METISSREAIERLLKFKKLIRCEVEDELDLRLWKSLDKPFRFEQCVFKDSIVLGNSPPPNVCREPVRLELAFHTCTFVAPLSWIFLSLDSPVEFISCRFTHYADFTGSEFRGFDFKYSNFDEGAYFEKIKFLAHKTQKGSSTSSIQFEMVTFRGGAEFDYAHFDIPVCFARANFYESSTFRRLTFRWISPVKVYFDFKNVEIFGSVIFQQSLRFEEVYGPILPVDQSSENGKITDIPVETDFTFVHAHKRHGLNYHSENLQRAKLLGTNLDACYFSNVEWPRLETHYPLALRKMKTLVQTEDPLKSFVWFVFWCLAEMVYFPYSLFLTLLRLIPYWVIKYDPSSSSEPQKIARECSWCSYEEYGIYDHCLQREDQETAFKRKCQTWEQVNDEVKKWRGPWTLLSRAYRDLKTAYEDNKDYIYASDFHYREKELRRINWEVPRSTRVQLYLYWLVSGYGERAMRPLGWFVLILLLGAAIYVTDSKVALKAASGLVEVAQGPTLLIILQPLPAEKVSCGDAIRYSAETMAFLKPDFLYLGHGLTLARCVAWAQAIAGPSLFAMFVLALKNKLKR